MTAIDRRAFLGGLAGAPLAYLAGCSSAEKVHRIGILIPGGITPDLAGPDTRNPAVKALLGGLRERGYVYGQQFVTEARGGEGRAELYPRLAADLVLSKVDIIVAAGPMLPAVKQATTSIPVVMAAAADPVEDGFAESLARPGGNFTGMSIQLAETLGKRLELLKSIVPSNAPVAIMMEPGYERLWKTAEAAARTRGWPLLRFEVGSADGLEAAFKAVSDAKAGSLMVLPSGLFDLHDRRVTELAARYRLPAMYGLLRYVAAGGLISYSPDIVAIWARAADFVDRILRGTKPSVIPIEQPTEFELAINLTAEKALGITFPTALRLQATKVIE